MVVTAGFFDGVHIGHRRVLDVLLRTGEAAAVVTFWPHPRVVLQQDAHALNLLDTLAEKETGLRSAGIDDIRLVEFTREFAALSAESFIKQYLIGTLGCTHLVLGPDNRFGSDALDTAAIASLASSMGLKTSVVEPVIVDGAPVSSTRIRTALTEGDIEAANRMLGYSYGLSGIVVPGNRLGRTIGFPTANVKPSFPLKAVPANGVYAARVTVDGSVYTGMTNIGVRPTVDNGGERVIETNIFDFDEDIYGKEIRVEFVSKVRNEQCFPSIQKLAGQLVRDKEIILYICRK